MDPVDQTYRRHSSGLAIAALVTGIFSLCLTPLGLVAVVLGIVALIQIAKPANLLTGGGWAIAGIVLGGVGMFLVTPVLLIATLLPALGHARDNARQAVEASNLRQISIASYMYAEDWNGMLPPSPDSFLEHAYVGDQQVFISPLRGSARSALITLHAETAGSLIRYGDVIFVTHTGPLKKLREPMYSILAFSAYTRESNGWRNVLFLDGHVEAVGRPAFSK